MTLRGKTLLIFSIVFASLFAVLCLVLQVTLTRNFSTLEKESTVKNVERARGALLAELDAVSTFAADWAWWDDTYRFVSQPYDGFIQSNLTSDTFIVQRLSLLCILDSSGNILTGKAFDLQKRQFNAVPEAILDFFDMKRPALNHSGIMLLSEGPMLIASRPVLRSNKEGPVRGSLVVGRILDQVLVKRLSETAQLTIRVYRFDDTGRPRAFDAANGSSAVRPATVVRVLDKDTIAGYALMYDVYGMPALEIEVVEPRAIGKHGQQALVLNIISVLLVVLALMLFMMLLLQRFVLGPLFHLSKDVEAIGTQRDVAARLEGGGSDEIGTLVTTINMMLSRLEQAQQALKTSEERFRTMAENIQGGITIIENDELVYTNDRLMEITGYPREDLVKFNKHEIVVPEDRERVRDLVKRFKERSVVPYDAEFWIIRKDGTRRCIHNRYSALQKDSTTRLYYIITTDITERKQAEETLKKTYADLAAAKEELEFEVFQRKQTEGQLKVVLEEFEKTNQELEEFAYIVSHDLKAPLRGIKSIATWLGEDYEEALDAQGQRYLTDLLDRTKHMHALIEGVLQYSRIGKTGSAIEQISSGEIVREVIEFINPSDSIAISAGDLFPVVLYDRIHLQQVLQNLIENAVKYLGGPEGEIEVTCSERDDVWEFCVRDNGIGIDVKHFERVFKMFQTLHPKDETDSTGIGLALVKKIVERYGGRAWVVSEVGRGSDFFFTIPKRLVTDKREGTYSVLIIDDNVDFALLTSRMLERAGHKSLYAQTGKAALDLVTEYKEVLDVALLDLNMPGDNPLDIYRELRRVHPKMRTVICTAEEKSAMIQTLLDGGADGLILKPFSLDKLTEVERQWEF